MLPGEVTARCWPVPPRGGDPPAGADERMMRPVTEGAGLLSCRATGRGYRPRAWESCQDARTSLASSTRPWRIESPPQAARVRHAAAYAASANAGEARMRATATGPAYPEVS